MVQYTSSKVIVALITAWSPIAFGFRENIQQTSDVVNVNAVVGNSGSLPLYCGLDVQTREDQSHKLDNVSLPPTFWPPEVAPEEDKSYSYVRTGSLFRWKLPDKLHVTVRYFGPNPNMTLINQSKAGLGKALDIYVTDVAFLAGGGLLCVKVKLCSLSNCTGAPEQIYKFLVDLAPSGWLTHVTLATSGPWNAVDSTVVLLAMEKAREEREAKGKPTPPADTWEIFSDVTIKERRVDLYAKHLSKPLYMPSCIFKYLYK